MMSKPLTRVLSLVLVLATLISYMPAVYAADDVIGAETEPTQIIETEAPAEEATEEVVEPAEEPEETEPAAEPEETEPAAEPEETEPAAEPEATEPAAEPEETEPAAEPEETEPATEPEETEPATEPEETEPEATEPVEEYAFPGMPEGYVLSEEELAMKAELVDDGTVESLVGLTAGEDYVADELIFTCDDEAYAAMVAAAYDAELIDCSYGVATIRLLNATVAEAIAVAADMENNMPAVFPNFIIDIAPIKSGAKQSGIGELFNLPQRQNWETWIMENLENPDPALKNPQVTPFQYHHDVINSYEAWGVTTGSSDIKVAVIDSGVWGHKEYASRTTAIDIGLGYDDDVGHGSHVAGIIGAALGNGIGGAGVAPGVSILSIKAGGADGLSYSYQAKAIRAAVEYGADVINMSFGGPFPNSTVRSAINYALANGVTLVAAMGNDGSNAVNYPAAYDGVIGVVATDATGNRSYYSNYGDWADVCAPGSEIYSTVPGGFEYMDGTSMASPVVAGVCALYMSYVGHVDPATMEKTLEKNCNKIKGTGTGAGIVDLAKMFDKVVNTPYVVVDEGPEYMYEVTNNATVSCDANLNFFANVADENDTLIYTINGKTPSVKNGQIVNGIQYDGYPIPLEPYAGTTITVRAAAVTGMGNISKVVTVKLKVTTSAKVTGVKIEGAPKVLVAGKKAALKAVVTPEKADQNVTWSIVSYTGNTYSAKIDAKGNLTAPKNVNGTVTVRATSKANPNKYADCTIQIKTVQPVATVKVYPAKVSISNGSHYQIMIDSVLDAKKNPVDIDDCGIQWTTSNAKVATVDQDGFVTAHSKGTATITCKVLDGSGKSAKCTVTVTQEVEYIEITGPDTIAPNVSTTYKAVAYPTNANKKTVTWELQGAPYGTTISTKGAVKVPKNTATGVGFWIVAKAADGSGVVGSKYVTVAPKCTGIDIDYSGEYGWDRVTWNQKTGWVSGVTLFNTDLFYDHAYNRSEAQLVAYTRGNNYATVEWSSSNTKVATVDQNGLVKAVGKGTATITCKALDGSNKKATVKVTVTIPVSQLSIQSAAPQMTSGDPCIAFGKSIKNTVIFGDTYGKPTNTKVTWDFTVKIFNTSTGKYVNDNGYYTSYCKSNKLVTLSNGTLKVSKDMKTKIWNGLSPKEEIIIAVTATAADGSGVSDTKYYYAIPGATKLGIVDNYGRLLKKQTLYGSVDHQQYYVVEIYSDQMIASYNQNIRHFMATSSNPKVCSVYDVAPTGEKGHYYVVVAAIAKGTSTITVKTTDGTNLSCSFTVKLSN